jgi:gliding motility-associated-like protein
MNTLAGCFLNQLINSDTITIIVKPVPEISFNTPNAVIKQGGNVQLIATITGGYDSFLWTPSAGLNSFNVLNPVANPLINTTYNLNVVSGDCAADKSVTVTVLTDIYIPSSFSPNGDGINDFFRIPPGTSFQLDNFYIYDKGGNLIFKTSDVNKGWNGFYKGIAVAGGNYVYMIKGTSNSKKLLLKGNIFLVR